MKIYQLKCYLNGYNRSRRMWESLYSHTEVFVGPEGLATAHVKFEEQKARFHLERQSYSTRKYREIRGKCELHIPHIHQNGQLAYWGDEVIKIDNPDNI